jgi:hypothetical protein
LRQLNLEQRRRERNHSGAKRGRSGARANRSAAQLDDWLWKNCREYAYELRTLEQSRM